jgi:hypothetical protein
LPPSPAKTASANLTPASGCQDHTTSPSALLSLALHARSAQRHHRVHRIPRPTFRDDGDTSLLIGPERGEVVKVICPTAQARYFSQRGLDDPNHVESLQQIAVYVNSISRSASRVGEAEGTETAHLICPTRLGKNLGVFGS